MRVEQLTAVIVNYDGLELTRRCVEALRADDFPVERIVIVDNGSRSGGAEQLENEFPGSCIVPLRENRGYGIAANAGAAALRGEAYLICNNDAFVHRGGIKRLLAALAGDRVGIVVPRLLNEDLTLQPTVKPLDTPGVALLRATGLSRLVPNAFQPRWSTHWDHSSSREVRAADGAVVMVRRETWEKLGGYNENIHMYSEDTDLCWRAGRLGWRVWFEHEAEFVHLGNVTSARHWSSPERAEIVGRSEGRLVRRQLSAPMAHASIAFTVAGLLGRMLVFRALRDRQAAAKLRAEAKGYLSSLGRRSEVAPKSE